MLNWDRYLELNLLLPPPTHDYSTATSNDYATVLMTNQEQLLSNTYDRNGHTVDPQCNYLKTLASAESTQPVVSDGHHQYTVCLIYWCGIAPLKTYVHSLPLASWCEVQSTYFDLCSTDAGAQFVCRSNYGVVQRVRVKVPNWRTTSSFLLAIGTIQYDLTRLLQSRRCNNRRLTFVLRRRRRRRRVSVSAGSFLLTKLLSPTAVPASIAEPNLRPHPTRFVPKLPPIPQSSQHHHDFLLVV